MPGTERTGAGVIRIQFPESEGASDLEPIGWDHFFEKFDEKGLALDSRDDRLHVVTSRLPHLVGVRRRAVGGQDRASLIAAILEILPETDFSDPASGECSTERIGPSSSTWAAMTR